MIIKLAFVFVILVLLIGSQKMTQSLVTVLLNILIFFGILAAINYHVQPVVATVIGCALIFVTSVFYQNQINEKTICTFCSVLIVTALCAAFTYWICSYANLQGFPIGQYFNIKESNGYSADIGACMLPIQVAVTMIVMLGTAVDTSLSVSSALYEVHRHNSDLGKKELFRSGISVGRDIVSSSIHTLFFIFIAEYMTLFIYLIEFSDFAAAVNSKELAQQVIMITIAGIASVLVIPVTSWICAGRYSAGSQNGEYHDQDDQKI